MTAHMECSPVSLSGYRKDRRIHHVMEDGAGVLAISLEMQSAPPEQDSESQDELASDSEDADCWDFATAVVLIEPFHEAAIRALKMEDQAAHNSITHDFSSWAKSSLSWLPRQPCPPTHNSICGYRIAMAEDVTESASQSQNDEETTVCHKRVTIYDFTPAHVERAASMTENKSLSVASSSPTKAPQSWAISPLDNVMGQPQSEEPEPIKQFLVTRAHPAVSPQSLADALSRFATAAPYIVSTRKIRLAPPDLLSVVHLTHDRMLFAQVCPCDLARP